MRYTGEAYWREEEKGESGDSVYFLQSTRYFAQIKGEKRVGGKEEPGEKKTEKKNKKKKKKKKNKHNKKTKKSKKKKVKIRKTGGLKLLLSGNSLPWLTKLRYFLLY